jgi:hypothetical protein
MDFLSHGLEPGMFLPVIHKSPFNYIKRYRRKISRWGFSPVEIGQPPLLELGRLPESWGSALIGRIVFGDRNSQGHGSLFIHPLQSFRLFGR